MSERAPRAGVSDCERCRPGLISQPVNAASSLGYVVAGIAVLRAGADRSPIEILVAWSSIAAGVGSVAFHGPGGPASKAVHDAGLIALLTSVGLADLELLSDVDLRWPALGVVPLASLALARSAWSERAQVAAGAAALIGETLRLRRRRRSGHPDDQAMLAVASIGAAAHVLGRTGGPLCAPDSILQPHAFWHLSTAATVWLRARSINR